MSAIETLQKMAAQAELQRNIAIADVARLKLELRNRKADSYKHDGVLRECIIEIQRIQAQAANLQA